MRSRSFVVCSLSLSLSLSLFPLWGDGFGRFIDNRFSYDEDDGDAAFTNVVNDVGSDV